MQAPDFERFGAPVCTTTDPDAYFPEMEISGSLTRANQAKAACNDHGGCPYKAECLAWALYNDDPGIWGGTTAPERDKMKRAKAKATRDKILAGPPRTIRI